MHYLLLLLLLIQVLAFHAKVYFHYAYEKRKRLEVASVNNFFSLLLMPLSAPLLWIKVVFPFWWGIPKSELDPVLNTYRQKMLISGMTFWEVLLAFLLIGLIGEISPALSS